MTHSALHKVSIMFSLILCAEEEGNSLGFQIAHSIGNAKLAHMSATSLCSIFSQFCWASTTANPLISAERNAE